MTGSELAAARRDDARGAGEALAARLQVQDGVHCERERTYYDTFDGLLRCSRSDADARGRHACRWSSAGLGDRRRVAPDGGVADEAPVRARAAAGPLRDRCSRSPTCARCCRSSTCTARERSLSVLDDERQDGRAAGARGDRRWSARTARHVAAAAPADHRRSRLRQGARPRAAGARRRARLQARRSAARRRGGQSRGRRARRAAGEDRACRSRPDQRADAAAAAVLRGCSR